MSPRTATVTGDLFDVTRHAWRAPAQPLHLRPVTVPQHVQDCSFGGSYGLFAAWCPCTLDHPDLDA